MHDLRFALRQLAKSPGFTVVAVLSLALGIGASTAVFSVVNAILLRSLPVPNPQELRVLHWDGRRPRIPSWNGGDNAFAPPHFFHLREQAAGLAEVFSFVPVTDTIVRARGESFVAQGLMVSDSFFAGLGVRPVLGRPLASGEDYLGAGDRIVISYEWWEKQFSLDPSVIGQTLALNGTPFTIIGVLPRGFAGPQAGQRCGFYVPMAVQSPFLYREITSDSHWSTRIMARVHPGVSDAQLKAALDLTWARDAKDFMEAPQITLAAGAGGETYDRRTYREPLLLLLGAVAVVMLVACANLAGLSLARGAGRQHELAVRAALGAGKWRLARQSLAESAVLAFAGSGFGLIAALWLRSGLTQLLAGSRNELHYDLSADAWVVGFTFALALLTALLSGLLPALHAGRTDPIDGLKSRGALSAPRLRAGRVLVSLQIGLSLLLLTAAGLYVRTLVNLARIDVGFATEKLLLFQLNTRASSEAKTQPEAFYARLQHSLAALPGAREACLIEFPLLSNGHSSGGFSSFSHRPAVAGTNMNARRLSVGETFFSALGIPIVQGRGLMTTDDGNAPKVVIVNETFVRKYLPNENPLGLTLPAWETDWQIVGVCRDASYSNVKETVPPTVYFPFRQRFYSRFRTSHLRTPYFAIRTSAPPLSLAPAVRHLVQTLDPAVAVTEMTTQDQVSARSIGQERLFALLCSGLAGLALLLSCIGLYGLMAYNVARRTREIGVRMALGATRRAIAWPLLREALWLATIGLAIGVPAALALARTIRNQLYGVSPIDPVSLGAGAWLLVAVVLLAAWLPTRRATRVDPMIALRTE